MSGPLKPHQLVEEMVPGAVAADMLLVRDAQGRTLYNGTLLGVNLANLRAAIRAAIRSAIEEFQADVEPATQPPPDAAPAPLPLPAVPIETDPRADQLCEVLAECYAGLGVAVTILRKVAGFAGRGEGKSKAFLLKLAGELEDTRRVLGDAAGIVPPRAGESGS